MRRSVSVFIFTLILLIAPKPGYAQLRGSTVSVMPVSVKGDSLSEIERAVVGSTLLESFLDVPDWNVVLGSEKNSNSQTGMSVTEGLDADYVCATNLIKEYDYIWMNLLLVNVHTGCISFYDSSLSHIESNLTGELKRMTENLATLLLASFSLIEYEEAIPFQLVEEKPTFRGGNANTFSVWVNKRLKYPEIAKENGVEGRVTLSFTVEKDGSVTNVKVIRGVDPALDKEAVRVVSQSPKWKPGKQRDRTVPVTYTFPVIFQLM